MAKTNENIENKDVNTEVQDGTATEGTKPETTENNNQGEQTEKKEKKSLLKKMKSGVDKVLDFRISFTPRGIITAAAGGALVAAAFVAGKKIQEREDNQLLDGGYDDTQALPDNSDTGVVNATYEEPADYVEDVNFAEEYVEE